jgi:hypothetical protein
MQVTIHRKEIAEKAPCRALPHGCSCEIGEVAAGNLEDVEKETRVREKKLFNLLRRFMCWRTGEGLVGDGISRNNVQSLPETIIHGVQMI